MHTFQAVPSTGESREGGESKKQTETVEEHGNKAKQNRELQWGQLNIHSIETDHQRVYFIRLKQNSICTLRVTVGQARA